MNNIVTMDDFTRNAVENFVQTVVFVDDKIYTHSSKGTVLEPKMLAAPKARKPAIKSAEVVDDKMNATVPNARENEINYSPHDIQTSFAKKSIVCSLHQPIETQSLGLESDTYKLCAAADIVIVDWDLYGDAGEKATVLIENLILQSLKDNPHQLRLILIYTDNPSLFDVADKVSERLSKQLSDGIEDKDPINGLVFHTLNSRVVVLGKPGDRLDEFKPFEVSEAELANRALDEFCKLADGLLQGCILQGLAAIRKQSRRILSKFHAGLDPAFLIHRALGYPHEEALAHIIPLLVAEIDSVLEDSLPDPLVSDSIISDWCTKKWNPTEHATNFVTNVINVRDFAADFCKKGMGLAECSYPSGNNSDLEKTVKCLKNKEPKWPSVDTPHFKTLTTFLSADSNGSDLRELAALMSQRTYYGQNRHMTLGTIVREISETGNEGNYLLCLQPVCDSVRLMDETTFLFCLLNLAKGEKATFSVYGANGYIDLVYKPGVKKNCITLRFPPTRGFVIAENIENTTNATTDLLFSDANNKKYRWIAQLKPKHAQRAVEQFARELSRVGLTESEWLRLKAK